jgi:hypothetical protein
MRPFRRLNQRRKSRAFKLLLAPIFERFKSNNELESRGYRPLQMTFDDQLKALIFYHLEEFSSGSELLQALEQNDFAKECVAPPKGIKKSSFFEAINTRGLEQLAEVFNHLVKQAGTVLPDEYAHLGNLVSIDGSLIDAVLSMEWADYRNGSKKAKAHVGFDINRGIPRKIFLSDGKEGERPFVDKIIDKGETAIMDRGYQSHDHFDQGRPSGSGLTFGHFITEIFECPNVKLDAIGFLQFYCFTISTRRFFVLPSSVPLSSSGFSCPHPLALRRFAPIPSLTRMSITDWAR